jgi:hypothetical protein
VLAALWRDYGECQALVSTAEAAPPSQVHDVLKRFGERSARVDWSREWSFVRARCLALALAQKKGAASQGTGAEGQYCWCRQGEVGSMIQCDKCNEWFHTECIAGDGYRKRTLDAIEAASSYLCIACSVEEAVPYKFAWPSKMLLPDSKLPAHLKAASSSSSSSSAAGAEAGAAKRGAEQQPQPAPKKAKHEEDEGEGQEG